MIKNEQQRLCGGTFFTLLLQARKPRAGVREHYMGETDGLSEPETLIALAKVMVPDLQEPLESMIKTIKGNTFDYKTCKNEGGMYFPFGDSAAMKAFDNRIKADYRSALADMSNFVDTYIAVAESTKKDERLVKALVELIDFDDSINSKQLFYVCEDGSPITKSDLADTSDICLQAFLLGIWHFAVLRNEGNVIGKETYETWCPSQGGRQRTYNASLGESITRPIHLTYCASGAPNGETKVVDDSKSEGSAGSTEQATPRDVAPGAAQQIVNNNSTFFNFNVTGNNNSFYNKVDTVIIKNGGRKDE